MKGAGTRLIVSLILAATVSVSGQDRDSPRPVPAAKASPAADRWLPSLDRPAGPPTDASSYPKSGELEAQLVWEATVGVGFEGSPTLCDLDHDGSVEAIVPVAVVDRPEKSNLVVFNAETGERRWETPLGVASFAYPYCIDVNEDGVDDVLVGGRTKDVRAVSGINGEILWSLGAINTDFQATQTYSVAAESPQAEQLAVSIGGGGEGVRVPGQLLLFGRDGKILSRFHEPNQREVYSSPAVVRSSNGRLLIAFGSGGETLTGDLHLLTVDEDCETLRPRLAVPSSCDKGGFVASPVFGDLTGDGRPELVAADFCGAVHALSTTGEPLWTVPALSWPVYANPLLTDLDQDGVLDVVAVSESLNFSEKHPLPPLESEVVALEGRTGQVVWRQRLTGIILASPLSADFDDDTVEDVVLVSTRLTELGELVVLSGTTGEVIFRRPTLGALGTPALGDFDLDGKLDILLVGALVSQPNPSGRVSRLEFPEVPFSANRSYRGFRGIPAHSGYRKLANEETARQEQR